MGVCVLVLGPSGSGKSTSLRSFEPGEVGIINVMSKPLPFRRRLDTLDTSDYKRAVACLQSGRRRAWVVDDATYLMQLENFKRAKETGYGKFTDMALHFQQLIMAAVSAPAECVTYLMMHTEAGEDGHERIKTIGKMLSEKFCIEGACPVVVECAVVDGRHVFVTENDGTNLAKAPMGMLPATMDNDLRELDALLREYWGMAPLSPENDEKKE